MKIDEKIRDKFGTWTDVMAPYIQSEEFDNIMKFLKGEAQRGKVICPTSKDTFKSFAKCNRYKMKAIMIFQDPYPTFRESTMIADGIPLSCSYTKYHQPSLYQFWSSLEDSYGFSPDHDLRNDLLYLLQEEHVMMINAGLSCEKDKSGSHNTQWNSLMKYWLEEVIGKLYSGLPIVLSGVTAHKLEAYINPMIHHIKKIEHPVSASYQNREFKYDNCYKWINNIIGANNGPQEKIQWLRRKNQVSRDTEPSLPMWVRETNYGATVDGVDIGDLPWEQD